MKFKTPVIAREARLDGGFRSIGNNGEVNASSKADLLGQIGKLLTAASAGEVVSQAKVETAALHKQMIVAAFASRESQIELGEVLVEELYQAANREGFARRLLGRQEIGQGMSPQVRVRMKDVVATIATSMSRVETQFVRDNILHPQEFYITTRPYVEKREIEQSTGDVLEEKYIEALEGTMVAEDRVWRTLADSAVPTNGLTNLIGALNPNSLSVLRNKVTQWNIPASTLLIANDLWSDISSDAGFQQAIDPVSQNELILTGKLGMLYGMSIISDAYRHPDHRVLSKGELYVVGDPVNHGQYTDRGGIECQPIDGTNENVPGRGWFMSELVSMVIANSRSVAKAVRV